MDHTADVDTVGKCLCPLPRIEHCLLGHTDRNLLNIWYKLFYDYKLQLNKMVVKNEKSCVVTYFYLRFTLKGL